MLTFLFEQYGYYPKDFNENEFVVDNWRFRLIEVNYDENYINSVDEYIERVRETFGGRGPFIIRTRFNKLISLRDGKKYVLVSVFEGNVNFMDLIMFHNIFKEDGKTVNISKIMLTWEDRINRIEAESLSSMRIDSVYYKKNREVAMFCLGLAQNAVQYLSDVILDYGNSVEGVCITHRRLHNLNSFDFFNPFNYIVDHPIKDIVELYKNDFLTFEYLEELMESYVGDGKIASLFMARLLYPAGVFDKLEENENKKSLNFKIEYNQEKELLKIKKAYEYLKERYNIRPINWL